MASRSHRVGTIDEIGEAFSLSSGWSHSGIVVLPDGVLVFAHPEGRRLVFLDPQTGSSVTRETGLLEMHGIALDPGQESGLWLADPGVKPDPASGYESESVPGRVVRWRPGAGHTTEIGQPDVPAYASSVWRPTSVSVDSHGFVWVADGYGANLIHKFTATGELVLTMSGAESGRRFDCPHGVLACPSTVGRDGEIYVADRGNRRILVYGEDGVLHRVLTDPEMNSPSCLAVFDGIVFVTELFGGLLRVDGGRSVSAIVRAPRCPPGPPWPNGDREGIPCRPRLDPNVLHSPHGIAVDAAGVLYTTEWCIGGRQLRIVLE